MKNTITPLALAALVFGLILWHKHYNRHPRRMLNFIKVILTDCIHEIVFVSEKNRDLPRRDVDFETNKGEFLCPLRLHFRTRFSLALFEIHSGIQKLTKHCHSMRIGRLEQVSRDVAYFEIKKLFDKEGTVYRIVMVKNKIQRRGASYSLVSLTISYKVTL